MPILVFSEIVLAEMHGPTRRGLPLYRVMRPIQVLLDGKPFREIAEGFISDLTSWPPILRFWLGWTPVVQRWRLDPEQCYTPAALLHDDLLENTHRPKWEVDWLYKGALRSCGVSALEAALLGGAVRLKRSRL